MAQLTIPMDAKRFATGLGWKDYMAQMGDTRPRTEDNYAKSALTPEERQFFGGLGQVRYALLLADICEAMPNCELKVFFRDKELDLAHLFLNNGYMSIPVVVFFDKDWNEVGRWIERAHAATQKAFNIRAKTLDVAPADQQDAAMQEMRKQVQDAYTASGSTLWREAAKEVRQVLETRLGLAAKK